VVTNQILKEKRTDLAINHIDNIIDDINGLTRDEIIKELQFQKKYLKNIKDLE